MIQGYKMAATIKPFIRCQNVSKKYHVIEGNQFWKILFNDYSHTIDALKDISLEVPKGELVGILGRNGSGKSTFLRVVGGVYSPTSGVINVNGSLSAIYELGVTSNEQLTGRKYAERWLEFCNQCKRQDIKKYVEEIHEFSELDSFFDDPIYKYSSGMKARLFFAVATAIPGKIYLIDEVLSVGDEYFQAKCWRRLREYFWQGASGILVTHDWTSVIKLCRSAYIFEKGKVETYGLSAKVVQKYLNLEKPTSSNSNFGHHLATCIKGERFQELKITLPVEVQKRGKIHISYSIEMFGIGDGWEHLLHLSNRPTQIINPGVYEVDLTIPALPLDPGEYSLNIFLMQEDELNNNALILTDARSWTYGNGLSLIVGGKNTKGSLNLPLTWKVEAL